MGLLAGSSETPFTDSPLVIGGDIRTKAETLITGQNLVAGTVLGRITASGKMTQAVHTAVDGSEVPVGILVHDIDATAEDKDCQVYYSGEFNAAELTWDASYTAVEQAGMFDGTPIAVKTVG